MDIKKLAGSVPDEVFFELDKVIYFGIDTEEKLANFLGQCDDESGGFKHTIENLNYSESALKSLFGIHFPNGDESDYARQPEKIANRIYANRMGNGDEESGDGWKYRGKGYIELTGKSNQEAFIKSVTETDTDLISTKYPLLSACWFWNSKNLSSLCIRIDDDVVTKITKIINGGNIGLENRIKATNKYYSILTSNTINS